MSKLGRNRKGRGYQVKKTGWKPVEADGEVRYGIVKTKSQSGVEYIKYVPIIVKK